MNIVAVIRSETLQHVDRIAVIEGDLRITYRELFRRVDDLAEALRPLHLGPGQRIGFYAPDGVDYIVGSLALLQLRAAIVPLTDSLTRDEILETNSRTDTHGTLAHVSLSPTGQPLGNFRWHPRPALGELDERCRTLDAAFVRFSSGTTGASKGVVLSHKSIRERTDAANRGLQITCDDQILWVLAMSHHFVVSILLFLCQGATIILAGNEFPFSLLEGVTAHPVTFVYASPVHYHLLATADSVPPDALAHVRLAVSTAMKMPRAISDAFAAKFSFIPAEAYGIIEIGLPFVNREPRNGSSGSVGRILPDYQLQIRNPDSAGIGEVLIHGPGMVDAYLSPWRPRSEILVDGFFPTGDLGRLDSAGRLLLLGRSKTVIICAGMKIFPEEVEEVLNAHPAVAESLVTAIEHPQFGQTPIARIVVRPEIRTCPDLPATLRRHCCEKLSPYKVPAELHLVPALPRTPSGKLMRHPWYPVSSAR